MKTLAEKFKNEYLNNNYDAWATICSLDIEEKSKIEKTPWTDSDGDEHEAATVAFSDGSIAVCHEWDVEITNG